ncbi:MAG: single-stranded-DNA-specific exonuclease RecJ [bacterium]|nr:single-stranded-DNA-specific exonuclease RecJ [bacterium]MDO8742266.1 single-stranded-DNA-specific exonuclease RecJ [bacterium]
MFPLHDPLNEELRKELSAHDDLTAALLARRGISKKEDAEKFLNPSYDLHLYDPLLMIDMKKAADRFSRAILSGEKIAVWSDYDCDGIPGGVLLHDFLKKAGANFENYIPHRHEEGYGMNVSGIEKLAKNGATLVVTVDSGITDTEPVARANELGINVIITDHHLPGEKLPNAFAVVNPNARDDETYPFRALCGSGVAWKLVCATLAVAPALRERVPEGWEKWLLDMVGLATIADMVPLVDENRLLATYGLRVMRKSPRLGLQKMCRGMRVEQRNITEDDVGFMIAPRVNAASRMGDARDAFQLFTTLNESEADMLSKKMEKANRTRKAESGAITRAVHTRLKERGEIRSVIALGDPEWRPALLGLVANTIADEYERPVFLWGREGNMRLKGSVRSGGATHIMELMRATEKAFVEFGGHAAAGGFTVQDTEVFFLEDRLVEAHEKIRNGEKNGNDLALRADADIFPHEVSNTLLTKIEKLSPFGMQNPKPVFLMREVVVREISRFGKGEEHLKLKIISSNGDGRTIDAVTFFAKGSLARMATSIKTGGLVHLLAHLERDTFSRGNPVRLRLLDIRDANPKH